MTSDRIDAADALPLTAPALLEARVASSADHVFLAVDDASLTYAEADRRSAELAAALMAHGAGAGTRVGLLFPNVPEFVVAWLAAARIGAVSVPLSTFSTGAELLGLFARVRRDLPAGRPPVSLADYVASLSAAVTALDLSAPASTVVRGGAFFAAHRFHRTRYGRGRRLDHRRLPSGCGRPTTRWRPRVRRSHRPILW